MNDEVTRYGDLTRCISIEEHLKDVSMLMNELKTYHEVQELTYQMSFAKRGEVGIWMNLMRKADRIDGIVADLFSNEAEGDYALLVDQLVDLSLYALKWLAVLYRLGVEGFDDWILNVWSPRTGVLPNNFLNVEAESDGIIHQIVVGHADDPSQNQMYPIEELIYNDFLIESIKAPAESVITSHEEFTFYADVCRDVYVWSLSPDQSEQWINALVERIHKLHYSSDLVGDEAIKNFAATSLAYQEYASKQDA